MKEAIEGRSRPEGLPKENLEEPQENELGDIVRQLYKERGFSLRRLADRVGMDSGGLSRALSGGAISEEKILRLADALRASPSKMLEAAGKLRKRFPYEVLESEGARKACQKVADGEPLTPTDKDWLLELWYAWHPPGPRRTRKRKREKR